MTKKHFVQFAQMVREFRAIGCPDAALATLVDTLVRLCASSNPRFDERKFRAACEVQS